MRRGGHGDPFTDEADLATARLMEAVVEGGNLMLAYARVIEYKGAAGVDELSVASSKTI